MICSRCGLSINFEAPYCPACGNTLSKPLKVKTDINYYELFELSFNSSSNEIKQRLREAIRYWGHRANNSPRIEQRHEAERMLQYLSEAELILLDPEKRISYDEWLSHQQKKNYFNQNTTSTQKLFPTSESSSQASYSNEFQKSIPDISIENNPKPPIWNLFWWTVINGTVVQVDPIYMAPPDFSWGFLFGKIILFIIAIIILGPIVIGIILGLLVASTILSFIFPSRRGHGSGFLSSIFSHAISFLFTKHLFGQKEMLSVRDIRLRDQSGQEHLVRIKGDIITGNFNIGDEIEVAGFNRSGTLMFRRGWNKRIKSEIRVKRR